MQRIVLSKDFLRKLLLYSQKSYKFIYNCFMFNCTVFSVLQMTFLSVVVLFKLVFLDVRVFRVVILKTEEKMQQFHN